MTTKQWAIIGILGCAVVIVFLGVVVLGLAVFANPSRLSPVVTQVTETPMLPVVPYLPSSQASARVYAQSILPVTTRFEELQQVASDKIQNRQYNQLSPIIDEMQKVRYSFWMISPPQCAKTLREDIERSMSLSIAGYTDYANAKLSVGTDELNQAKSIMAGATILAENLNLTCELARDTGQ